MEPNNIVLINLDGDESMGNLKEEILVAYDIVDTKIRNKVFESLKDYGLVPIQKSVFWGEVLKAERLAVERLMQDELDKEVDKVFIVKVSMMSLNNMFAIGYSSEEFEIYEYGTI